MFALESISPLKVGLRGASFLALCAIFSAGCSRPSEQTSSATLVVVNAVSVESERAPHATQAPVPVPSASPILMERRRNPFVDPTMPAELRQENPALLPLPARPPGLAILHQGSVERPST